MNALFLALLALLPQERPDPLVDVGFDQRLGEKLPLDAVFTDQEGRSVRLDDVVGERPVVLALVYYECPMLCNLVLNGLVRALRTLGFESGEEFDVVAISIDPEETPELARAKLETYVEQYGRGGEGWTFLVGDEPEIRRVTDAAGFRYHLDEATGEYAHAAGLVVVTPEGELSRYFYGVEYSPRDLRLALVESADGRIGSVADQVLLLCFHYDPERGKYGLAIMTSLRILGIATVVSIVGYIVRKSRGS